MAVRKSAVKKSVKTAARRARSAGPGGRTAAAKSTRRRRLSRNDQRPASGRAELQPEPPAPEPRPQAVLPVPLATFVF